MVTSPNESWALNIENNAIISNYSLNKKWGYENWVHIIFEWWVKSTGHSCFSGMLIFWYNKFYYSKQNPMLFGCFISKVEYIILPCARPVLVRLMKKRRWWWWWWWWWWWFSFKDDSKKDGWIGQFLQRMGWIQNRIWRHEYRILDRYFIFLKNKGHRVPRLRPESWIGSIYMSLFWRKNYHTFTYLCSTLKNK